MMSTPNQVPRPLIATPTMYQNSPTLEDEKKSSYKITPISKYMECLKNHAASIGGNAKDGCGEFMPGGTEGTIEALKCSACNCHRNFHRKIYVQNTELGTQSCPSAAGGPVILGHQLAMKPPGGAEDGILRKRARTKFSQEQKEKMYSFAEKCGWKITKVDDSEVRSFCQEIGIKRKVLKVWMHNNKYHTAKKRNTQQDHKDADEMHAL